MSAILHIGMQKTGTSALQYFFNANRQLLQKDGISYPHISEFDRISFSGVSYHNCIAGAVGDYRSTFAVLSSQGLAQLRECLLREQIVLLSGEDFSRILDLSRVEELFRGVDTKVVVYLREQCGWAESAYNQRNKILFNRGHDRLFSPDILSAEDLFTFLKNERYAPLLQYDRLLQRWIKAFGRESVVVRLFDKHQMVRGDIGADVMSAIGVQDLLEYEAPPRVNENLANAWINLIREIAIEQGVESARVLLAKMNSYSDQINLTGATGVLSPRIKNKMRDDYASGNQWVAREFFGRDELFPVAMKTEKRAEHAPRSPSQLVGEAN